LRPATGWCRTACACPIIDNRAPLSDGYRMIDTAAACVKVEVANRICESNVHPLRLGKARVKLDLLDGRHDPVASASAFSPLGVELQTPLARTKPPAHLR